MTKEKYGFVYIWRDRKHKRYYIGSHWGTEDDGYICSSRWMRNAYNRRKSDFKRRVVSIISSSRKDLLTEEERWMSMIKPEEVKIRYYNLKFTTNHWHADEARSVDIKQRISEGVKKAMSEPENRQRYEEGLANRDNRSSDPEVRDKRSKSMKKAMAEKFPVEERKVRMEFDSPEYKEFMRNSTKELWNKPGHRESVRAKISQALKGKKKPGMVWWNDGTKNTRSKVHPGEGWTRGRLWS